MHPLVTLLSMVLGTCLFGGIGLLGLPITIALLHALNKEGAIHLYKMTDDAPEPEASKDADAVQSESTPEIKAEEKPPKEKPLKKKTAK